MRLEKRSQQLNLPFLKKKICFSENLEAFALQGQGDASGSAVLVTFTFRAHLRRKKKV